MKLGIIADIHEDLIRLKQAVRVLASYHCDRLICLGDIVGYSVPYYAFLQSRNAHAVLGFVRKKCDIVVVGNHDLYAIKKLPVHQGGFRYPKNWYALSYRRQNTLSRGKIWRYQDNELSARLTPSDERYIAGLPEFVVGTFDGVKILLSHYAFPNLVGDTTFEPKKSEDVRLHFAFMKRHGCQLGISGHDHQEGIMKFTPHLAKAFPFGTVPFEQQTPTWLHVPSVVNGSFANGVTIVDTKRFIIKTIPLKSRKHRVPNWGNA